ncbi:MAG: alpha/beta fold hydrolase [Planctomycetaceae bacterium]
MGWAIVGIVAGLALADLLLRLPFIRVVLPIFENIPPFGVRPSPPVEGAESFEIPFPDRPTLRGSLHHPAGKPRGLIVFCPELQANHWSAAAYCPGLLEAGFAVLAFDFRNQGESGSQPGYEPLHWMTRHEVNDLEAVLDHAASIPELKDLPVGLFGVSRGGGVALAVASKRTEVRCVVCDSSFSIESMSLFFAARWAEVYVPRRLLRLLPQWHLRSTLALVRWISQWRRGIPYATIERKLHRLSNRPVMMIAGTADTYVRPAIAHELARRIGPSCTVWVVKGAKHNQARAKIPEEYDRRIVEFFTSGLR